MQDTLTRVPTSLPTDSDDVIDALEIAAALWEAGDRPAATRCVRRAAEAADMAGDVARMAALAGAAAELDELRPAESETRAKVTPPASTRSIPPPAPSSRALDAVSAPRVSVSPPAPPSRSSAPPLSKPPSLPKPPPPSKAPPSLSKAPAPPLSSSAPAPQARLRVSVRTSVRDPALLVVRPLPGGQSPPPGTREAFLVMADDESLSFTGSRVG
jgi:hypothetical protein